MSECVRERERIQLTFEIMKVIDCASHSTHIMESPQKETFRNVKVK